MAQKAQALLIDSIGRRWSARSAPAVSATAVATMSADPGMPKGRHVVDSVIGSFMNRTAAAVTVTASVRDASIAGTVLADADFIADSVAAAAGAAGVAFQMIGPFPGLRGNAVVADLTAATSVIGKITMAGWTESFE